MSSYIRPRTLEELLEVLENAGGEAKVLAGGTDLMLAIRAGKPVGTLVNVSRIESLGRISVESRTSVESKQGTEQTLGGEVVKVGSGVTVARLLRSEEIRTRAPLLWKAADRFASPLVRSRATVGGNLGNASPAADLSLALLALDATVELAKGGARRTLSIDQFFRGPGRTVLEPGEVVIGVSFPTQREPLSTFQKSGPRPALEIAVASVAMRLELQKGRVVFARVAYGAVAPTPLRGYGVEAAIVDRPLTDDLVEEAARAAVREIRPIDDVRATATYRRRLIGAYVHRALSDARVSAERSIHV
ncbi:MAG: FAD binding domain-containing protein [Deltaproteobacteria bacterium]|nr:FAD binding domain-containing protein [Deltaproteobacteria bacterium]